MADVEKRVWDGAIRRIASIFGVNPTEVHEDFIFGDELKNSFVSDFKRNEFDVLSDDIRDVSDRSTRKDLESGALVIRTVGDYCRHMVHCHEKLPVEVDRVLDIEVH